MTDENLELNGDRDIEELSPCPSCFDGSVWDRDGPTARACKTCMGYAVVKRNGGLCDDAVKKYGTRRNSDRP